MLTFAVDAWRSRSHLDPTRIQTDSPCESRDPCDPCDLCDLCDLELDVGLREQATIE
jgi:hypothetical protein